MCRLFGGDFYRQKVLRVAGKAACFLELSGDSAMTALAFFSLSACRQSGVHQGTLCLVVIEGVLGSETLAPFTRDVMDMAGVAPVDLDAISISSGPGSYTGLRVGTSFAKAMCFALDIPLIAVDTLEAIAHAAIVQTDADAVYVPNIDARRMEVYLAVFDRNGNRIRENTAALIEPGLIEQLVPEGSNVVFCGNGSAKGADVLKSPDLLLHNFEVHARHLVPIAQRQYVAGEFADMVQFKPEYLKSPNITVSTKPRF